MLALSIREKFLDETLLKETAKLVCPLTYRFKVGYIVGLFVDQRKKLIDKPIRELTDIGYREMIRLSNIGKRNYPAVTSDMYHAHFLGKVNILDVHQDTSSDLANISGVDEYMTTLYGKNWKRESWTVIGWDWLERYFMPGDVIE